MIERIYDLYQEECRFNIISIYKYLQTQGYNSIKLDKYYFYNLKEGKTFMFEDLRDKTLDDLREYVKKNESELNASIILEAFHRTCQFQKDYQLIRELLTPSEINDNIIELIDRQCYVKNIKKHWERFKTWYNNENKKVEEILVTGHYDKPLFNKTSRSYEFKQTDMYRYLSSLGYRAQKNNNQLIYNNQDYTKKNIPFVYLKDIVYNEVVRQAKLYESEANFNKILQVFIKRNELKKNYGFIKLFLWKNPV